MLTKASTCKELDAEKVDIVFVTRVALLHQVQPVLILSLLSPAFAILMSATEGIDQNTPKSLLAAVPKTREPSEHCEKEFFSCEIQVFIWAKHDFLISTAAGKRCHLFELASWHLLLCL